MIQVIEYTWKIDEYTSKYHEISIYDDIRVCVILCHIVSYCVIIYLSTSINFHIFHHISKWLLGRAFHHGFMLWSSNLSWVEPAQGDNEISPNLQQDTLKHAKTSHDTPDESWQLMTIHDVSPRSSTIHTFSRVCVCTCISAMWGVRCCMDLQVLIPPVLKTYAADCIVCLSV